MRPSAWFYRYKREGADLKLSLGPYPGVMLAAARKKSPGGRGEAGTRCVDARDARRVERERERVARLNTFELMARTWHGQAQKDHQWSAGYLRVRPTGKAWLFRYKAVRECDDMPRNSCDRCDVAAPRLSTHGSNGSTPVDEVKRQADLL